MKRIDNTFGSEKRIKKRRDFLRLQSSGKKWKTDHFLLVVLGSTSEKSRLGVTITRKVHKRAVKRNLLKRRIKEIFRKLYGFILEPSDVVVIAQKDASELDYLEIKREINYALRRLGVLEERRGNFRTRKET